MTPDRWDEIARRIENDGSAQAGARIATVARSALHATTIGLLRVVGEGSGPVDGGDIDGGLFDEAQTVLGEGPTVEAIVAESPILADDLASTVSLSKWPGFVTRAAELGVKSMFAFPMRVGGVRVGVVSAYRETTGPLTPVEFADGLVIASLASLLLMDGDHVADSSLRGFGDLPSHSRLQLAAGVVSEQLDVPVRDALVRLRAHAYANDLRLDDVARAVIDQTLVLDP